MAFHLLQSFTIIIIRVNELKTIESEFPSKFKGLISFVFLFFIISLTTWLVIVYSCMRMPTRSFKPIFIVSNDNKEKK